MGCVGAGVFKGVFMGCLRVFMGCSGGCLGGGWGVFRGFLGNL